MSSRSNMVLKRNLFATSKQVSRSFTTSGKTCSIFTKNSKRTTAQIQSKKIVRQSNFFGSLAISIGAIGIGLYCLDARSAVHEYVLCPLLRLATSAEDGHKLGIKFLKYGIAPRLFSDNDDEILQVDVFGKKLKNPVGMAAGFDKEGEVIDPVLDLGFSYIEIGSITPEPQPGNPKPRFFRLPQDDAVINRYGFNSSGHLSVLSTLRVRFEKYLSANPNATNNSFRDGKLLAINLGKNKTGDEIEDYVKGVQNFGPYADVLR
ncbi:unnamed protein product [[Candida] boidinii]|nr:unnamed protein product [[Candida] boidinii]